MKKKSITISKKIGKKQIRGIVGIALLVAAGIMILLNGILQTQNEYKSDPELLTTMAYEEVKEGEEAVDGTNDVQFDAFFLRDLNGDGYAEGVRGMCRQLGQEDTLYMELKVLNSGRLKNGQITINSSNFYLQTAIAKDAEVANNYISNNTKKIELNELRDGTQKLLTGIVRSGDYSYESNKNAAIGKDISKYSKENSVTLTGTLVEVDGTEKTITKTVPFMVDWHGIVNTEVYAKIEKDKKETSETVKLNNLRDLLVGQAMVLDFNIDVVETANELNLRKSYVEGIFERINGFLPTKIEVTGIDMNVTYDENTGKFTIIKEAQTNEKRLIIKEATSYRLDELRYNRYKIKATYPKEAYAGDGISGIELRVPVKAYYEGYNNTSEEFEDPYKSNEAQTTIVKTWKKVTGNIYDFTATVGTYIDDEYIVSKEKPYRIYNKISEAEENDRYQVDWHVSVARKIDSIVVKETIDGATQACDTFVKKDGTEDSMENVTTNIGIYFSSADEMLEENGWIKIYNAQTNELIETFNKANWNTYTQANPYYYEESIKHIRVETSRTNADKFFVIHNVKELDDAYITGNYTLAGFENIEHIKTNIAGTIIDKTIGNSSVNYTALGKYQMPVSVATISVESGTLITQQTNRNKKITISTTARLYSEQKWKNGVFLVKLPSNIVLAEINNVTTNNDNVKIVGYDIYEEDGNYYIKVLTENVTEEVYDITLDCDLTPDPRELTSTKVIELYASNGIGISYKRSSKDYYDVNNNLNKNEEVGYYNASMSFIAPNSLLTSQMGSEYDSNGTVVVAPKVAVVNKEQKAANISVSITNNYSSTISEIAILGKIPFKGNTTILTQTDLGSTYTATIRANGIQLPTELQEYATVYYSEKETTNKNLKDSINGWKKANEIKDWSKIRTYLIDCGSYVMPKEKVHMFKYGINLPEGLSYNEITYSSYAVYFSLDTTEGKYRTNVEPNKLGFKIAKQYDLEITKYQEGTEKLLPGITYMITEEGTENSRISVTNQRGQIAIRGLYSGSTYIIKEVIAGVDYELNQEEVKFRTKVVEDDQLQIDTISGIRKSADIIKEEGKDWKLKIALENKVKSRFKIVKKGESEAPLRGIKFKLNGKEKENLILTTNIYGEVNLQGLCLNETYTLEEIKADGYYLMNPVTFKITKSGTDFNLLVTTGVESLTSKVVTVEDEIPTINFEISNEKIPTFDLEILKIKKDDTTNIGLEGAQFKLEGEGLSRPQYYTTDVNGNIGTRRICNRDKTNCI